MSKYELHLTDKKLYKQLHVLHWSNSECQRGSNITGAWMRYDRDEDAERLGLMSYRGGQNVTQLSRLWSEESEAHTT